MTQQLSDITVGFIGYGAMAQAMAQGFVDAGVLEGSQMLACAGHYDKLVDTAAPLGVRPMRSATEVAAASDIVILAVKPNLIEQVVTPILHELANSIVVCVAWGWTFDRLESVLENHTPHISIIPNTPIAVGQGVSVVEDKHNLTEYQAGLVRALLEPVSMLETVDTAHMSQAGTISSCAPAFTAMYIEALADAGVQYGLKRASAYRLAAKMVEGTGALQVSDGRLPAAMKDAVCSPGGATIRGVVALEQHGFRGDVISAVQAVEG